MCRNIELPIRVSTSMARDRKETSVSPLHFYPLEMFLSSSLESLNSMILTADLT